MIPLLLALAITATPCPSDLLVANPRLKVNPGLVRGSQHEIVTVDVKNRGVAAQRPQTRQRLDLLRAGTVIGSQPIPALGAGQAYVAAFRLRVPATRKRAPLVVRFRYVLESRDDARENCTTANDTLDATL